MEFYCIHNFVTAVYVSRQGIRLTSQWPHVYTTSPRPPLLNSLFAVRPAFPDKRTLHRQDQLQKIKIYAQLITHHTVSKLYSLGIK
jgi:hypothetical protein